MTWRASWVLKCGHGQLSNNVSLCADLLLCKYCIVQVLASIVHSLLGNGSMKCCYDPVQHQSISIANNCNSTCTVHVHVQASMGFVAIEIFYPVTIYNCEVSLLISSPALCNGRACTNQENIYPHACRGLSDYAWCRYNNYVFICAIKYF